VAVALNIAAGDASHVGMYVASHVTANLDVAAVGLDTLAVASYLDSLTIVDFKTFNIALDGDVYYFLVGVDGIEFLDWLAVNISFSISDCDGAALNDSAAVVVSDNDSHISES
jgi:hypothetical protein